MSFPARSRSPHARSESRLHHFDGAVLPDFANLLNQIDGAEVWATWCSCARYETAVDVGPKCPSRTAEVTPVCHRGSYVRQSLADLKNRPARSQNDLRRVWRSEGTLCHLNQVGNSAVRCSTKWSRSHASAGGVVDWPRHGSARSGSIELVK